MAYFAEGSDAMVELEAMVDKVGVRNVIHALEHICREKEDHVQSTWQDANMAREWRSLANYLARLRVPSSPLDSHVED